MFNHPDPSWTEMILITLGSRLSASDMDGECRLMTLLWLNLFLAVMTVDEESFVLPLQIVGELLQEQSTFL